MRKTNCFEITYFVSFGSLFFISKNSKIIFCFYNPNNELEFIDSDSAAISIVKLIT